MAWPIIAAKLLLLKFVKGAVLGIARYLHRVFTGQPRELTDRAPLLKRIKQNAFKKENLIFLILMLGNFFYGLQELTLITWGFVMRKRRTEYFTGMPAALEPPHDFCKRVAPFSWPKIWREIAKWFLVAGLFYWPGRNNKTLRVKQSHKKNWIDVRWQQRLYLVKTHTPRTVVFRELKIVDLGNGEMEVSIDGCEDVFLVKGKYVIEMNR